MKVARIKHSMFAALSRLLTDRRGDMTQHMLVTACGVVVCGLAAPHVYKSADVAKDTFDQQVKILQRGSSPGGGTGGDFGGFGSSGGLGGFNLSSLMGGMSNMSGSSSSPVSGNSSPANGGGTIATASNAVGAGTNPTSGNGAATQGAKGPQAGAPAPGDANTAAVAQNGNGRTRGPRARK